MQNISLAFAISFDPILNMKVGTLRIENNRAASNYNESYQRDFMRFKDFKKKNEMNLGDCQRQF